MRYDKKIKLIKANEDVYNEETGDYEPTANNEKECFANITNTKKEYLDMLYGKVPESAKTIRIKGEFNDIDYILIGDDKYNISAKYIFSDKTVLMVVKE